jgi:hypothetical protein
VRYGEFYLQYDEIKQKILDNVDREQEKRIGYE